MKGNKVLPCLSLQSFTLIELLVVIAIIIMLAGMMLPAFSAARTSAKNAKAKSDVKQIEIAWKSVLSDYRTWAASGIDVNDNYVMDNAKVLYLQGGSDNKIRYMEFPSGTANYMDPWKVEPYHFALGYSSINPPGHGQVYREVGAWSYGRNISASDVTNHVASWK